MGLNLAGYRSSAKSQKVNFLCDGAQSISEKHVVSVPGELSHMMCTLCSCHAGKEIGVVLFMMQYWPSCLRKIPAKQSQEQDIIAVQEREGWLNLEMHPGLAWTSERTGGSDMNLESYWFVREGRIFQGCHIVPPNITD